MKVRMLMCTLAAALAPASGLLLAAAPAQAQAAAQAGGAMTPAISGFNVEEVARLEQGVELHFTLYGAPGGQVTMTIDGATRGVQLTEVEPGQYSGTYTIGVRDRVRPDSRVSAEMRLGGQVATSQLRGSLVRADAVQPVDRGGRLASQTGSASGSAPGLAPPPDRRATERPRVARYCTSCAIVERVEVLQGAVPDPARPRASDVRAAQRYRVVVRFTTSENTQAIEYDNNPGYRVGDRVRVNNGVLALEKD